MQSRITFDTQSKITLTLFCFCTLVAFQNFEYLEIHQKSRYLKIGGLVSYFQTHANKLIIWIILAASFVQFLVVVVIVRVPLPYDLNNITNWI